MRDTAVSQCSSGAVEADPPARSLRRLSSLRLAFLDQVFSRAITIANLSWFSTFGSMGENVTPSRS